MKKRVYTSIAIVATLALLFVLKVYVSDYFFDAFFGVLSCIASYEMSKLLSKTGLYNFQGLAIFFPSVMLAANLVGVFYVGENADLYWLLYTILIDLGAMIVAGLAAFIFGLCRRKAVLHEMQVRNITGMSYQKFSFKKALNTMIIFVYPAFLFLFFIFVNHIENFPLSKLDDITSKFSVFVLLSAILIPMIADTFAMLMGSLIGGKKLAPKISPNKTISGAIGGILWSVLFAAMVYFLFACIKDFEPFFEIYPIWAHLLIVFFGAIISECGDLFESIIKRRANVSDSGRMLPGHGGLLDRIDSYIFVAPYILIAFWIFAL